MKISTENLIELIYAAIALPKQKDMRFVAYLLEMALIATIEDSK
ncbi:MAG: hypothetical protein RIC18_14390 [Hoeflea sp.]